MDQNRLPALLEQVLREPTPEALWALRAELLAQGNSLQGQQASALQRALKVSGAFFAYLIVPCRSLTTKLSRPPERQGGGPAGAGECDPFARNRPSGRGMSGKGHR